MHWTVHLEGGPRRVNHASVAVSDTIYSFGGYCTGENYALWKPIDVHILDTTSLRWKLNTYSSPMSVPYRPDQSEIPFQRYGHTVVASGELIYLWGGRNDNYACNVLYCFDTVSLKWLPRPKVSGSIPHSRDGHTACNINNNMYIFGGYVEETDLFSNDIYVLDLNTYVWKYLRVNGIPPSWRDFHSAVAYDSKMFVFGGRSDVEGPNHSQQEIYCNVIMYFDTTRNTWVEPVTTGVRPCGRRSHSAFVYNNCIYVFGGYNGIMNKHFNDLHKYDPQTRVWSLVKVNGDYRSPCPRRRQCCCIVDDRLFLFGGTSPYNKSFTWNPYFPHVDMGLMDHSDLYVLDFNPSLKTLSILVAIENNLIQSYLPNNIKIEIAIMTKDNCISRPSPSNG